MSNVLIGIVGIILFIGLALAGASFFGPVVTDSLSESKANGTMQVLSKVATAIQIRNREMEVSTPSAVDASVLVPEYLDEIPRNPTNSSAVYLLNSVATVGVGGAAMVATKIGADAESRLMCLYLNRSGGSKTDVVPLHTNTLPTQRAGCVQSNITYGPFLTGDYVAYVRMD